MAIDYQSAWTFAGDALNGTGGFSDGTNLDKFGREDDEDYAQRKSISEKEYENFVKSKVTKYNGYIYKDTPIRETKNTLIQTIVQDADRRGNDINVFMSSFTDNAKIRGVNLVLVDMPTDLGVDLNDQIERRLTPYLVEILPERVTSYKMDLFGNFEYVAYTDTIDLSTYEKEDVRDVTRYYDAEIWRVYEGDTIIEEGQHSLGVCPVLIFSENGKFQSTGEFYQIAGMSKKIYNLESEMKHLMRGQSFSLLTAQKTDGAAPDLEIGVHNVLYYTGTTSPDYISSDASQAAIYESKINAVKNSINAAAYDEPESSQKESGLAKEMRFQALNSSLAKYAQRLEGLERKMWAVCSKYLGMAKTDMIVVYNMDFNITDLESEIANLDAINSIVDLPLYRSAKLKKIVKSDLPSLEGEGIDALYLEIDNNAKESEMQTETTEE